MRRAFVVGNWKMNTTLAEARALVAGILKGLGGALPVDVGLAPPATLLMPMCKALADGKVLLGAQNVFHATSGAYTGEISPAMLLDAGCRFVIIGHSERRRLFGEHGDLLNKKVAAALQAGLQVIYCVGETLEQREDGQTASVVQKQLSEALVRELDWRRVTVAYEPVWAIGTGHHATPAQAQQAHEEIRAWLAGCYGDEAAAGVRIQYGGSVTASNAASLLAMPDVDGALVGGASLDAGAFLGIIEAAASSRVRS